MIRRALLPFVGLLLAGCAAPPAGGPAAPAYPAWTQLGPGNTVSLRAVVPRGRECPTVQVDGQPRALAVRASPSGGPGAGPGDNPAAAGRFDVLSCALELPAAARQAVLDGQALPLPRGEVRRIVVVGDTGCRIKVPASGRGDPIQDCGDPGAWPWAKIAAAAARTRPDLVIHLGDYHYREYCDDPGRCGPVHRRWAVGYGWPGWQADFFAPAAPLLAAAPWVVVRGNHENCDRAGEGWMRFLAPGPYRPCPDQRYRSATRSVLANNLTADAYRLDLGGGLALAVADNAGQEDYRPAAQTPADGDLLARQLAPLEAPSAASAVWLLAHRPIWYELLGAASQPNAFQAALRAGPGRGLQAAFSGHEHAFETINFAPDADSAGYPAGRPAQVIVGGGGTQLEALDPDSALYEGAAGPGGKERTGSSGRSYDGVAAASGLLLNRHGFLLLERDAAGWAGMVLDAGGQALAHCRLDDERKDMACVKSGI